MIFNKQFHKTRPTSGSVDLGCALHIRSLECTTVFIKCFLFYVNNLGVTLPFPLLYILLLFIKNEQGINFKGVLFAEWLFLGCLTRMEHVCCVILVFITTVSDEIVLWLFF